MWLLENETPFAAERTWTRDEKGAEFWLVALRACFEIDPNGQQRAAAEQTEVKRFPEFAGDPMTSGLRSDSDFALSKTVTDILVEGSAVSANGEPVRDMQIRFKVADVDKTLKVVGHRGIYEEVGGVGLTAPAPFTEMPIRWENAFGGWDRTGNEWEEANPVGRGFATKAAHLADTQAPNIEYENRPYRGHKEGKPAGIGPVAHHWQPRVKFAGTYDKRWSETRDPLVPLDFDRRYFHSAPMDQQTSRALVGYENVRLAGFSQDGILGFVLPRLSIDIITSFKRAADVRQTPSIHTLWLYPNKRRFELVYLSALEVPPGREEKLVSSTIRLRRRIGTPQSILRSGVWTAETG
ncbi:DUF2169 domain-containing protein [Cognatiyoonia sp. IB215446]|uniref:DUF2169 family type VI secretion system accessory protein n=1 Tax=Cognatiyoonia sp. IB215446 TaxID=3097355 RepID=UPI002A0FC9DD|nr:DUF2169 domain-containing protein [Cognatiyoonia sp. IB215446]MDX8350499.1 DUF2169 domain-containing protein [Cognatiyoonia sp. IB215446]